MKKAIITSAAAILTLGMGYLGGVGYYAEKFTPNTKYGSVEIGNLTLAEAENEIQETVTNHTVKLTENGQAVGQLSLANLGVEVSSDELLQAAFNSQDPSKWFLSFFDGTNVQKVFADQVKIDADVIADELAQNNITNENRTPAINAEVVYNEEAGYFVESGQQGTTIDYDKLGSAIVASLEDGNQEVALESVYSDPEISEDSDAIKEKMAQLDRIFNIQITQQIAGDEITIPTETIRQWLSFDENNELYVDGEQVSAYLVTLNEQYSTYYKERQFESTLQGTVTVPPGILGWEIDIPTETENIIQEIHAGENVTRKVAVTGVGAHLGEADEIGSTYVEVDLTNQMMYLYVDGEIMVATNIVSGRIGQETVPGANAVIEMMRDTNLKGFSPVTNKDYSVPVSYWIRFDYQAQGLHDATWQWAFGGDHHYEHGSLGCINTPLDQVAIIYEYVDYGTPVLVFY